MVRAVALIAGTALLWLLTGAASALGFSLWWVVAIVPTLGLLAAPFLLFGVSKERTGPTWGALAAMLVLLPTAYAVPGDWYMRQAGVPTTSIVMSATCTTDRNGRCLYNYTIADVKGEYRDTAEYAPGTRLELVIDPHGIFGPRLAADLESHVFDIVAVGAFAGFAAAAVAAALMGRNGPVGGDGLPVPTGRRAARTAQSRRVLESRPRMKKRPRRT
ncbi:hypothetical protein GCM10010399_89930 [Dactylosporangium fulvum]|uniref:DUF3592 domain-containing protein n=1 Tax=Dactylosporangium fulvum TaxID=53359 RepID=A0ABY5VP04_9ACTN|nr:hypothetical protein [Dactylosporangium fulvum]UWP79473.1 hypothetical protein Dfulv_30440 [Dactylosporangium fulvum]